MLPSWYVLKKILNQQAVSCRNKPYAHMMKTKISDHFAFSCLIVLNKIELFYIDIEKIKLMENVLLIFKVTEKPRVSFGPIVEKMCRSLTGRAKHKENTRQMRLQAKGHFTPNPSQKRTPFSSCYHTTISNHFILMTLGFLSPPLSLRSSSAL